MDAIDYGYLALAAAIIEQACDDYKFAYVNLKDDEVRRLEKFFRSKYFSTISNINPEKLIHDLREKYSEKRKKKIKEKWEKKNEQERVTGCIV